MSKSVYSLVLSDELITLLDKVAYKKGLSRSNMINTLIAEYLSFETPEKRAADIVSNMQAIVNKSQSLKFLAQQSNNLASICSAISFKYNPTVKYTVELYKNNKNCLGELKVSLRSTSVSLLNAVNKFYWLFISLEKKHIGQVDCSVENEKFFRKLNIFDADKLNTKTVGEIITSYVKNFNILLNMFFANLENVEKAYPKIEEVYLKNLKNQPYKIF